MPITQHSLRVYSARFLRLSQNSQCVEYGKACVYKQALIANVLCLIPYSEPALMLHGIWEAHT